MERGASRVAARAGRCVSALLPLFLCLALGACASAGANSFALQSPSQPSRNSTIAFESIDGPPPAVFRRLVQKLGEEAQARQVPMVSREGFAPYRVRGYLAAGIEKKKKRTLISWVWDVYDSSDQQRAFRISGEEVVNGAGADAWAMADDVVLSRIAQKGMAQLADYIRGSGAPGPGPAPSSVPDETPVSSLGQQTVAFVPRQ